MDEPLRTLWSSLLRLIGAAEDVTTIARVRRKLARGRLEPVEMVAHLGYGTSKWLRLQARVLEARGITPGTATDPWWRNVEAAYRRFAALEIPAALVQATADGQTVEEHTDVEGYVQIEMANTQPEVHGWREVELELLAPLAVGQPVSRATAHVLLPDPRAEVGIISDIDDTVIHTGLTETAGMLRTTLLHNASTRLPFPGAAAFYRALHDGAGPVAQPIFYVSGSPWNLYDMIEHFLEIHDFPPGPLFLKDWGIDEHKFIREDTLAYKAARIDMLMEIYSELDFVLIGDSGQADPEIYAQGIERWPHRIRAVYIRDVTRDAARDRTVRDLLAAVASYDVPAVFGPSTLAAASDAALRGLIAPGRLDEIRRATERDRAA